MIKIEAIITNKLGQRLIFDKIINKETYFLTEKEGKFGVLNLDGIEIIKPIYDEIILADYSFFIVREKQYKGLVNFSGKLVVPVAYTDISTFCIDGRMVEICIDNKIGLFDTHTDLVIRAIYDSIKSCATYMYKVKMGEKFGVINSKGEVIIPIKYDWISSFYDFVAKVSIDDKYGYVTTEGKEILKPEYDEVSSYIYDYKFYFGKKGKEYICVLSTGKMVFRFDAGGLVEVVEAFKKETFDWCEEYFHFNCGICLVKQNGRYKCMIENGISLIEGYND